MFSRSHVEYLFNHRSKRQENAYDYGLKSHKVKNFFFFDSNPLGRIQTRFSKDVSVLDVILPGILAFATYGLFRTITVTIVIIAVHPYIFVIVLFAILLMYLVFRNVTEVMIQTQREDSVYRGPINSSFTNIVNGLVSVRAYDRMKHFRN